MRMRIRFRALPLKLALAVWASLASLSGAILYNNDFGGVSSGDDTNEQAWTISSSSGEIVANSFSLPSSSSITGINLLVWLYPGESVTSLDYAIYDNGGVTGNPPSGGSPLDGNELYSGTISGSSLTDTFLDKFGDSYYDIDEISLALPGDAVWGNTTYWLVLQNAMNSGAYAFVGWDQSDGPSSYWGTNDQVDNGYAGGLYYDHYGCDGGAASTSCSYSESFELLGTATPGTAVPEPGTAALLGGSVIALVALRRRRARPLAS